MTKNFQSYIGELLEKRIIGESQLIRFIEHLEKGELINPISEDEALTSTPLLVQRRGLQQYLNKASLDQKELLDWSRATLAKRARVRVKREEVREETRDPYQKLEFHPVKRPVSFEMRDEKDKMLVTLTYPTEVQSTPVTQKQWVEIMGENPSRFVEGEEHSAILTFHGKDIKLQPDNPVEYVTWWSVLVFANRLSEKHGLPPAYDLSGIDWEPDTRPENGTLRPAGQNKEKIKKIRVYAKGKSHDPSKGDIYYQVEGYRLPTEAEQKYMLQGGGNMKSQNFFKDEAEIDAYAWHEGNSDRKTYPVGLLQAMVIDGKSFYDLYGNVRELAWDNWEHWEPKLQGGKNPVILATGRFNGGGWGSHVELSGMTTTIFSVYRPSAEVGFRLVRTIEPDDGERGNSN